MHGDLGPNFGLNYKVGKEFHEWFKMGTRHDLKRQWPAAQTCTTKDYARFYQQSEMLRERHAGNLFEAQGGKLSAALGAHALELEVANAPGEGGSGHYMYRFRMRTELILIIAKLRVQAPNVSAADLADGGVAYAKTFVYAKWGDADGTKLMPGALGYTVWLVQPDGGGGDAAAAEQDRMRTLWSSRAHAKVSCQNAGPVSCRGTWGAWAGMCSPTMSGRCTETSGRISG
jgi:hypothetical protein